MGLTYPRVVLLLAIALVTLVLADGVARAHPGGHSWESDGCTYAPDKGEAFDFRHACIHHDGCYSELWAPRRTCDEWFLEDMYARCAKRPALEDRCTGVADVYFAAVRIFGEHLYGAPMRA